MYSITWHYVDGAVYCEQVDTISDALQFIADSTQLQKERDYVDRVEIEFRGSRE